jgi:hypothetical protein
MLIASAKRAADSRAIVAQALRGQASFEYGSDSFTSSGRRRPNDTRTVQQPPSIQHRADAEGKNDRQDADGEHRDS